MRTASPSFWFGLCGLVLATSAPCQTVVSMWVHDGAGPEVLAHEAAVKAFNAQQTDIRLQLVKLPEGSYNDQVNAAALARKLPCVLEFDGPQLYSYAWTKKILPLDGFAELAAARAGQLPSLLRQGNYQGRLYSLGQFDSGLALWGSRKLLTRAGVRIPTGVADVWTQTEFEAVLKQLKASGVATPLDMKFNYGMGEWYSYGFAPIVQSFGGDLIERPGFRRAQGVINGPATVRALSTLQGWARAGYINPATKDDADFVKGKAALSWVGHWVYRDYRKALGDDLVLIGAPQWGGRAVTGAGSWNFGISAHCKHPQAAARVLAHLLSVPEILRVTAVNGAVPGTQAALAQSSDYGPTGALRLYVDQLRGPVAVVRPETPAYPAITTAFAEALNNVMAGAAVQRELDRAARKIDESIEDNRGYPAPRDVTTFPR
jgi:multiple sugar transport system substrate-binding protein